MDGGWKPPLQRTCLDLLPERSELAIELLDLIVAAADERLGRANAVVGFGNLIVERLVPLRFRGQCGQRRSRRITRSLRLHKAEGLSFFGLAASPRAGFSAGLAAIRFLPPGTAAGRIVGPALIDIPSDPDADQETRRQQRPAAPKPPLHAAASEAA